MTNTNNKGNKMFTSVNDVWDAIEYDETVIGMPVGGRGFEFDECDIYDGVVVHTDWDGNDVFTCPKTNVIVGHAIYGGKVFGIDEIS
jgi:hypothetical protein